MHPFSVAEAFGIMIIDLESLDVVDRWTASPPEYRILAALCSTF